jgi:hypothetical protein
MGGGVSHHFSCLENEYKYIRNGLSWLCRTPFSCLSQTAYSSKMAYFQKQAISQE